ncbi:M48 family metallopeptidase [Patescibacteria group bacterium]|nr:M48 family metallopeptidase [Patescibacteria group bacterium]MBU1124264.1 M48 family metallopeptidase [Patescibacteria group bacterium]MBU1911202.1 M48 family metallopeptidase [Patescibacteria group bacterium]
MNAKEHQQRAEHFKRRVHWWARKLNVEPTQVRVQKMTRKWASCSTKGWVSFSEDLLFQSREFQKYVIVHELLHFHVPNHGKLWKSLMRTYVGYHKKIEPRNLSLNSKICPTP